MEGIEIDGKLLVDGVTPVNSPSIAPTGCSVGTKQGFSIIKYFKFNSDCNYFSWIDARDQILPYSKIKIA